MPATVRPPSRGPMVGPLSTTGIGGALVMSWVALSPSLLPRGEVATAAALGVSMAFGYLIGSVAQRAWVQASRVLGLTIVIRPVWAHRLHWGWFGLLIAISVSMLATNARRQPRLEALVDLPPTPYVDQLVGVLLGVVLFGMFLALGFALASCWRWTTRRLAPLVTRWIAPALAAAIIALVITLVAQGLIIRPIAEALYQSAASSNATPWQNRTAPTENTRSGGPGSLEPWDSLGAAGQAVASDGPRAADITRLTGQPAKEPIRVYAGLRPGRDLTATAAAVVAELDRTNAWSRAYLVVATSVGNGWVDEWSLESVEYLTNGDCASASMQYSYLKSGIAYVLDHDKPNEAGRALWTAVRARWLQLPTDHRPKLLANGESLGSSGGQAAFDSPQQMIDEVDGAVWVGTTHFTPLWRTLTDQRRQGSPEIAPVIDNGRAIRFATGPSDLEHDYYGGPYDSWGATRIVYLQHASDPIVWWSPDLLWREPDWARERVGRDVSGAMFWAPWVSFWQIAIDMTSAVAVPAGHGHNYEQELVPVWSAVLHTDASQAQVTAIQEAIRGNIRPR